MSNAVRNQMSAKEIMDQVDYNPLIGQLLLLDYTHIRSAIEECRSTIFDPSASEAFKNEAKSDISDLRQILHAKIQLTKNFLKINEEDSQLKLDLDVKEDNVRVMIPKKGKLAEKPAEKEKVAFEKRTITAEEIENKYSKHVIIPIKSVLEVKTLNLVEEKLRTYRDKVDVEILKDLYLDLISLNSYPDCSPRLLSSQESLFKRFEGMVIKYQEKEKPQQKSHKKVISRISRAEAIENIKDLVVQNKIDEAFAYGNLQFRQLAVIDDTKPELVLPMQSEANYLALFQTIVPGYAPKKKEVEQTTTTTTEEKKTTVELPAVDESLIPDLTKYNYEERIGLINDMIHNVTVGNINTNKAIILQTATKYLVEQSPISTKTNEKITHTLESISAVLEKMYEVGNFGWVWSEDVDKILEEANLVISRTPSSAKGGEKVKAIKDFMSTKNLKGNALNLMKAVRSKFPVSSNKKEEEKPVVDAQTDIKSEAKTEEKKEKTKPVVEQTNALVFTRSSIRTSDPELFTKYETASNIQQLTKACKEVLESHEWVTAKNLAIDLIEAKKINECNKWVSAEGNVNITKIDNWFNANVLTSKPKKVKIIEANTNFDTEKPVGSPLSEQSSTSTTAANSEKNSDGDKVEIAIPIFTNPKELRAYIKEQIIKGEESHLYDTIKAYKPYEKNGTKWVDQYMLGIRKEIDHEAKKAKKESSKKK